MWPRYAQRGVRLAPAREISKHVAFRYHVSANAVSPRQFDYPKKSRWDSRHHSSTASFQALHSFHTRASKTAMTDGDGATWHPPLKAPTETVEIVDLTSDDDAADSSDRPDEDAPVQLGSRLIEPMGVNIDGAEMLQVQLNNNEQVCLPVSSNDLFKTLIPLNPSGILEGPTFDTPDGPRALGVSDEEEDEKEDEEDDEGDEDSGSPDSELDGLLEAALESGPAVNEKHFSAEETSAMLRELRQSGEDKFVNKYLLSKRFTARQLCSIFPGGIPWFLEDAPEDVFLGFLKSHIDHCLSKRVKLEQYNTIDDAVMLLKESQNIVVLTGAGISTSLGIPDFRSKETGLYSQLEHLGLNEPQEVFDISTFREDPTIFYTIAKDILPSTKKFSPTHAFIRLLQDKDKLLTNFTQNVDNLEKYAGIYSEKLIQCHGSFATASCLKCGHKVHGEVIHDDIKDGKVPHCDMCLSKRGRYLVGSKRKRSSDSNTGKPRKKKNQWDESDDDEEEDDDIPSAGVMKPDITFFGEALPATFHDRLVKRDRIFVDLVVVIGTSLKVAPVSEIVNIIPTHVPQIYISREACSHVSFDIDLLGDCDLVVTELCRRAGWELKHDMVTDKPIEATVQEGHASRYSIDLVAPSSSA